MRLQVTLLKLTQQDYLLVLDHRMGRLRGVKLFASFTEDDLADAARLLEVMPTPATRVISTLLKTGECIRHFM